MNLTDILDRPIAFQRPFVYLTKSINAALFLSQAVYWSKRTSDADGWFYKKQAEWEDETGLTRREQDTARKILRELGILEENLAGVPATLYFRIDAPKLKSGLAECAIPVRTKAPSQIGGMRQTTIKTETTSETTSSEEMKEVVSVWNASGLPQCLKLTPKRAASLKARLNSEFWRGNWRQALVTITQSPFCTGKNDRGWKADFDFFTRSEDAVANAMEGRYGATTHKARAASNADSVWQGDIWLLCDERKRGENHETAYVEKKIKKALQYTKAETVSEYIVDQIKVVPVEWFLMLSPGEGKKAA